MIFDPGNTGLPQPSLPKTFQKKNVCTKKGNVTFYSHWGFNPQPL